MNTFVDALFEKSVNAKPEIMERQLELLDLSYDLSDDPAEDVSMARGKPVQEGVRVRLPEGVTSEYLASLSPEEVRAHGLFPAGFLPLPHPFHGVGGMLFPEVVIEETLEQTGRDLARFDVDFDLPQHFLPEFPPPIFLTTRAPLGRGRFARPEARHGGRATRSRIVFRQGGVRRLP